MATRYSFKTKITSVKEHFDYVNWRLENVGGEKQRECDQRSIGWYITLEGSRESIYTGDTKPDLVINQRVTVSITPELGV
jgi:hypothetical protein